MIALGQAGLMSSGEAAFPASENPGSRGRGDSAALRARWIARAAKSARGTVVFLSHRGAEQRHEAVAGEMRRRSAEASHLGKARRQKRAVAHRFGSQLF